MKKIEIYTINCPYCDAAKELLKEKNIPFKEIDIRQNEEEYSQKLIDFYHIEEELTFPQIIIGTERIGGYDELKKLSESGQLDKMIED